MKIDKYGLLGCMLHLIGIETENEDQENVYYSLSTIEYLHEKNMLNKDGEELYKSIKEVVK